MCYHRKAAVMWKALLLVLSGSVVPTFEAMLEDRKPDVLGKCPTSVQPNYAKCFLIFLQSTDYTKRPDAGTLSALIYMYFTYQD